MFRNLKVGTRLILCFLAVALLGAVVAGIGIYNMDQMNARAKRLYEQELLGLSYAKEANVNLVLINRTLRGAMLASTEARRQKSLDNLVSYQKEVHDNLERARPLFTTEKGKRVFAELDDEMRGYGAFIDEQARRAKAEPLQEARDSVTYMFDTFLPHSNLIDAKMDQLAKIKEQSAREVNEENAVAYTDSRSLMLVLVLCSLAAGAGLGMLITRSLTRQLGGEPAYAAEVAGRIAGGDLATPVELRSGDTGSLLFAMHTMRDKLATIVTQVRGGTDAIGSASSQIAAGNLDLSSRTEEQASSLEETASSMEELTSTVKQNADNARQANALAATATGVAGKGGAVVAQVVETMGAINTSAGKIVEIISVIDGIAFQTNILALNAAVEAARAGEQGRGFAVVAGEVRNLAQRSAQAAKEIKGLIEDSVNRVDMGSVLVESAGETMGDIVNAVTRVTDIMGEIASASDEQSRGIDQVGQAVAEMDRVTQQNASLVEESASAAAALEEQASMLTQSVAVFRLKAAGQEEFKMPVSSKAAVTPVLNHKKMNASDPQDNWETF